MKEISGWFKFGIVRGIIGLAVSSLLLIAVAGSTVAYNKMAVSGISIALLATSAPLAVAAILFISGFEYWIGNKLLDVFEIRAYGLWRAIGSGMAGGFLCYMIAVLFVSIAVAYTPVVMKVNPVIALLVAIPASIISEAGYAVVTWKIYELAGVKTPE